MEPTNKEPVPVDTRPAETAVSLPTGSIGRNYGGAIGVMGLGFAILEFLRDDPHETFKLLGEFGPKYLLFAFLAFVAWDLLKRLLKLFSRGVDHIGSLAQNTGAVAAAVQEFAGRSDRGAEEMRRLCSFSASQSERAVEVAQKGVVLAEQSFDIAQKNNGLLQTLVAQGMPVTGKEVRS